MVIEVTVFPDSTQTPRKYGMKITVVIVHGEVQMRRDQPGILCNSVEEVKDVEEEMKSQAISV